MVAALERALELPLILDAQPRPAMAADVVEGPQPAVAPAQQDDTLAGQADCLERAGADDRLGPPDADPHPTEDRRVLAGKDRWIDVVAAGQRRDERVRGADGSHGPILARRE